MLEDRFYLYRPWIPVCKSIEAEALRSLDLIPPILDIGCGDGRFAAYCFNGKIDAGLDYDKNAVEEAKKKGIYREVKLGDAREIPFADNSFSTVVSVCAIEHIPELYKVLSNIHRVLKTGGVFIFTVPSEKFAGFLFTAEILGLFGLKKAARRYGERKNRSSGHFHVYAPSKWDQILRAHGFEARSINYIFPEEAVFLWSLLHSLPFKLMFLPFRLLRDFNIKIIDDILRTILKRTVSGWIEKRSDRSEASGGYLLIQAMKG